MERRRCLQERCQAWQECESRVATLPPWGEACLRVTPAQNWDTVTLSRGHESSLAWHRPDPPSGRFSAVTTTVSFFAFSPFEQGCYLAIPRVLLRWRRQRCTRGENGKTLGAEADRISCLAFNGLVVKVVSLGMRWAEMLGLGRVPSLLEPQSPYLLQLLISRSKFSVELWVLT